MTNNAEREAFEAAFPKHYQWSDSNKKKAFFGWMLAAQARTKISGVCKYCGGSGRQMNDMGGLVPCNCNATSPKSASVPIERLEALMRPWRLGEKIPDINFALAKLIAEYKP